MLPLFLFFLDCLHTSEVADILMYMLLSAKGHHLGRMAIDPMSDVQTSFAGKKVIDVRN